MKKMMKRIGAVLLAVAMMAAVSVTAWAAGHSSITINNAVADHTYTAYQILKGDYSAGTLSNVVWGDGITADGKAAVLDLYDLDSNATAADVAAAIAAAKEAAPTSDQARLVAEAVGKNTENGLTGGTTGTLSGTTYTISNLDDGYYVVEDTYTGSATGEEATVSRFMVQVAGEATVNNKAETPTVEKKIVEGEKKVEANTANIGDDVTFELTSNVPDMTGYTEYYMDFNDTLSKGLTYKADSLSVSIGGTTLDANAYTLTVGTYSETNGTSITVHLKDMVSRNYTAEAPIVITYTATVNENAVIGDTGNPNTVTLDYTNNPQDSGDGTPDNPDDDIPNGTTPQQTTNTFVTGIELTKIEKGNSSNKLAGAVFNVKGSQINKVLITGERFVEDAAGTYYELNDGTYTTKAPTDATASNYKDTSKKYKLEAYSEVQQETKDVEFQVVSGSDGKIAVTGLKEGTYTFDEIQAPDGYNLLSEPIEVTVTSNIANVQADPTATFAWAATSDEVTLTNDNGVFKFDVENAKGTQLPETGGIGTYVFTIAGAAIMAVAAGLLVIRRKKA